MFAAALAITSVAGAQEPDPPLQETATVDVNGDGKPDTVSISAKSEATRFTLKINAATLTATKNGFYNTDGFQILKLNANPKVRYIAVLLSGDSDDRETRLFLYNGKTIRPAGVVPATVVAPTGIIYAEWWMGFWQCKGKFLPDANGVVQIVPQAGYYVGKTGTVKTTFVIRAAPSPTAPVVANVAPNSKVELILYKPVGKVPGDPMKGYYLFKTSTGLCGWADYKAFDKKISDLPWAG